MTNQFFKTVLAGILAGVALYLMPFIIIKVLFFILLIKAIFRLMGGGRNYGRWRYAYAHKYQNMTEEERKVFMEKYGKGCGWSYPCEQAKPEAGEDDKKPEK